MSDSDLKQRLVEGPSADDHTDQLIQKAAVNLSETSGTGLSSSNLVNTMRESAYTTSDDISGEDRMTLLR